MLTGLTGMNHYSPLIIINHQPSLTILTIRGSSTRIDIPPPWFTGRRSCRKPIEVLRAWSWDQTLGSWLMYMVVY